MSQTSVFFRQLDARGQLLRDAALQLFADGVIAHPSNAAIAKYTEATNVASYVCVFHDWCPDWAHLKYHDLHLHQDMQKFQERVLKLAKEGNKVAVQHAWAYPGRPVLEQIYTVAEQLKQISFYMPATADILHQIRENGKCWTAAELDYEYLLDDMPARAAAEAAAGKEGHFRYGVELEKIYLSTRTGSVFAEYFLQEKQSHETLAITASCIGLSHVQSIGSLDKVIQNQNLKTKFGPIPLVPPAQANVLPPIPNPEALIAKIEPADGQSANQREQVAASITRLSGKERMDLDAAFRGQSSVSIDAMAEAIAKIKKKGQL